MNAVDLIVEDEAWAGIAGKTRLAQDAVAAICEELDDYRPGVVAILLTGDAAVAVLNGTYRDTPAPTNVLAFPSGDRTDNHLGDIALAGGVVAREAGERGIAVADHLRHLIVHGFLHLQGYDHQDEEEAEIMEDLERRALRRLGVDDPYDN